MAAYGINICIFGGKISRLESRKTGGETPKTITRYTIEILRPDGKGKNFIPCVVFGQPAEFAATYLKPGDNILVRGKLQTGSYTNKSGNKVYTTECVVEEQTSEKDVCININLVVLIGRPTKAPDIRYTAGENPMAISRYTQAVSRGFYRKEKDAADFLAILAFAAQAEYAEKHVGKGEVVAIIGWLQSGSYVNKDGDKVYTYEVVADKHILSEKNDTPTTDTEASKQTSKKEPRKESKQEPKNEPKKEPEKSKKWASSDPDALDGFTSIPEDEDDELPFKED